MSGSNQVERAFKRVRESFDNAADDAEAMSEQAKREVREAIDDLENQVDRLRNRD